VVENKYWKSPKLSLNISPTLSVSKNDKNIQLINDQSQRVINMLHIQQKEVFWRILRMTSDIADHPLCFNGAQAFQTLFTQRRDDATKSIKINSWFLVSKSRTVA